MSKLIVILGITGNQGGSVAKTFAKDPEYKVRGVTRDPTKPESRALIAQGVELVRGDFDDISSLKKAFAGAHTIFANTAFNPAWVTRPEAVAKQLKPGQTFREWCYETELRQGKNVADAVATVNTLELFIWSTLSAAKRWSKGKYSGVYHFEAKANIEEYINKRCPAVARKMSLLQMGLYVTNWRRGKASQLWQKRSDGSLILKVPGGGNVPIPLVIPADTGEYAKALTKLPLRTNLLAYSDLILWEDFAKLWSKVTGVPVSFKHGTIDDMDREGPGGYGIQIGEMLAYSQDFGYWGGDPSVTFTKDVEFDIPVTSLEEFIRSEDWSRLIDGPVDIN